VELNGKYGIINTNGEFIADCIYDEVYAFSEDFAIVQLNGKYGFINTKGKRIDCIYDHALAFRNGFAQVQLNGKWGFINTEGKWFDTIEQGKKWLYMNQPFSKYAKNYVETRINEWQKKGEFEKTIDWQARVNKHTREQKIAEYVKQAEQQFIAERSKEVKYSYTLGQYDADNEVYLVKCDDKELLVPVPIAKAEAFKSKWSSIVKTPKFFIENDRMALAEVSFRMPGGKTYKYSNAASLNYTIAQVDYNFDPIEIDVPTGNKPSAGQQNISTVNVSVGKADVDTDIPQCNKTNDRTFAVIIANENYSKLAKVPFALNDGKTFGEYCRRTLGLPQSNIRFYGDATYGTMLAAVNDIGKIAAAYNGNIRVIFYYAGHGAPNENTQEAFLMPVDAYGVGTEACYSLDRLYNELGALGAKNVTVFLDACFSGSTRDGAMLASARGVAIKPKAVSPHGNMVVFSAASADETALPYNDKGHGLFTYFLLKKLQLSEGDVTFGELGDYITEQVRQKSTVVNRKSQTPTVTVAPTLAQTWKTMCF
ncbi:MAG TPA: WG repeat-containing protein, partial [Candidatus Alistipes excrementipullorum]|nr:WG repeat-containing protein [Candidatus Alistipes excrementipullorum]